MDAAVASTGGIFLFILLLRLDQGGLGLRRSGPGCNSLGGAGDDLAISHEALDQPVALALADHAGSDTSLAEVIVTIITGAAVVVLVWDDVLAVVAVDRVDGGGG